ncbi:MAG: hypothetical protein R3C03_15025 [Pirellulaceae bacterium]
MISRALVSAISVFLVCVTTDFASAQSSHCTWTHPARPLQGTGRFLGLGYGHGYHSRNPGPVSDYYNPYNARNSQRIAAGGWSYSGVVTQGHPAQSFVNPSYGGFEYQYHSSAPPQRPGQGSSAPTRPDSENDFQPSPSDQPFPLNDAGDSNEGEETSDAVRRLDEFDLFSQSILERPRRR